MNEIILKTARKILSGKNSNYVFNNSRKKSNLEIVNTSVYVHIPFCKNLCPYCPYNRVPYDEGMMSKYLDALKLEIEAKRTSGEKRFASSVYFGGGTPTLAGEHLKTICKTLRNVFDIEGDFCIETSPTDTNENVIKILDEAGFSFISIGVQSFKERHLKTIGRNYKREDIERAIVLLRSGKKKSINIDMMFALPNQTEEELIEDIKDALKLNPDQITCYPLFAFPYSEIAEYKKIKSVSSPSIFVRRRMYYLIYDTLQKEGYQRCSVWSFRKNPEQEKYSSVTRERYMGFGASAGTYHEKEFTLNTFSVSEYISSIKERGHASALKAVFTKRMAILYDFYWRLYDTYIPKKRVLETFSYSVQEDKELFVIMMILKIAGWAKEEKDGYTLTRSGSLWVHFIQNMFSLRSINKIWSEGKKNAWPERIEY